MIEHALRMLLLQTLALSVATCVVRLLQASVLRRLGAAASYLAWLLVPVAMLATALPHPARDALAIRVDVAAIAPSWATAAPAAKDAATPAWVIGAMAAWFAGAALLSAVLWRRQRGFEALVIPRAGGSEPGLPAGAGPAVLGVWRPRIVLPRDFDSAFDAEERRLMLLHEGVHLRRADNAWNLLATVLLVLHWFNPVAWWAWRRVRADQELACDAAVLRNERACVQTVYANALLKVQGVALAPPLATAWQSTHPLVERIRMLQRHRISYAHHRTGLRVVALCILVAGFGGYALRAGASATPQAASADKSLVSTAVEIEFDKSASIHTKIASKLLTVVGQKAMVRYDSDAIRKDLGAPFEIAYTATRLSGDRIQIDAEMRHGESLGSPRLITQDGEAARIGIKSGDGAHTFDVTFVPKILPPQAAVPDGAADARKPADQRAL